MQECGLETFPCACLFTRSLAVENFRGKGATPCLLCDVGIVQLTEATDCRQEQVPQPFLPGFHLEAQMDLTTEFQILKPYTQVTELS